jgi:glycerate 2-kinase
VSFDHEALKQISARMWTAGLDSVRPEPLLFRAIQRFSTEWQAGLQEAAVIHVVGAGKAGTPMVRGLGEALPDCRNKLRGIVNVPGEVLVQIEGITLHPGRPLGSNHPTHSGVAGAERMLAQLRQAEPNDVAICLLSGGGSALLPAPVNGITLEDKQAITKLLHGCGATIVEMNTIRKHLSRIKGGRLAEAFRGKLLISLIISDVVGDPLDVIASGPTVPDPSTFADCWKILERYALIERMPQSVKAIMQNGMNGTVAETPKALPDHVHNLLIGSNEIALQAAITVAREHHFNVLNLGSMIEGDSAEVASVCVGMVRAIQHGSGPISKPACIIFGGETTVNLGANPGKGGRNQEFVLAMLAKLGQEQMNGVSVVSLGTDGEDGPTDAAGAIGTCDLLERAHSQGLNPETFLQKHNSYHFFEPLNGLIKTGLTGTNVMDLRFILIT